MQPRGLHTAEVPNREPCGEHLTEHSRDGGAHHAPAEAENEERVQDYVNHSPRDRGGHGEARVAVGAYDGIHGLTEHVEGYAESYPEEVFFGEREGLVVDSAAEHGEDGVVENEVGRGHNEADDDAEDDGAADAAVGVVVCAGAEADAHEGAAAVAYHDGQCERHDGQRKGHRVGSVAVGAEVGGVGNKNLVNNVVE